MKNEIFRYQPKKLEDTTLYELNRLNDPFPYRILFILSNLHVTIAKICGSKKNLEAISHKFSELIMKPLWYFWE